MFFHEIKFSKQNKGNLICFSHEIIFRVNIMYVIYVEIYVTFTYDYMIVLMIISIKRCP